MKNKILKICLNGSEMIFNTSSDNINDLINSISGQLELFKKQTIKDFYLIKIFNFCPIEKKSKINALFNAKDFIGFQIIEIQENESIKIQKELIDLYKKQVNEGEEWRGE